MAEAINTAARAAASRRDPHPWRERHGKECWPERFTSRAEEQGSVVGVNIAALPETLVESELFGHERARSPVPTASIVAGSRRPAAARCCSTR